MTSVTSMALMTSATAGPATEWEGGSPCGCC